MKVFSSHIPTICRQRMTRGDSHELYLIRRSNSNPNFSPHKTLQSVPLSKVLFKSPQRLHAQKKQLVFNGSDSHSQSCIIFLFSTLWIIELHTSHTVWLSHHFNKKKMNGQEPFHHPRAVEYPWRSLEVPTNARVLQALFRLTDHSKVWSQNISVILYVWID